MTDEKNFEKWFKNRIFRGLLKVSGEFLMYKNEGEFRIDSVKYDEVSERRKDNPEAVKILNGLKILKSLTEVHLNANPFASVPSIYREAHAEICRELAHYYIFHQDYNEAIKEIDDGIMKGAQSEEKNLCKLANFVVEKLGPCPEVRVLQTYHPVPSRLASSNEILKVSLPSLEFFYQHCIRDGLPIVIKDMVTNFPIFDFFDFEYLNKKCGHRRAPIEFGSSYASDDYSQTIMTIHEYLKNYFEKEDSPKAYLAQHALLDQLDLIHSVIIPDYCSMFEGDSSDSLMNVFIGPSGTISPLHFDPKPNFFCQIRGRKFVRLVHPQFLSKVYMNPDPMHSNSSLADLENPDYEEFPLLKEVVTEDVVLEAGDCLFIPARYLHLMRSLSPSISISIWTG